MSMAGAHRRRGCGRAWGPRATGKAQEGRVKCDEHRGGGSIDVGALHDGGPRQDGSAAVLPHSGEESHARESRKGKLGVGEVGYLERRLWHP